VVARPPGAIAHDIPPRVRVPPTRSIVDVAGNRRVTTA
jgi:hypothetical protein